MNYYCIACYPQAEATRNGIRLADVIYDGNSLCLEHFKHVVETKQIKQSLREQRATKRAKKYWDAQQSVV